MTDETSDEAMQPFALCSDSVLRYISSVQLETAFSPVHQTKRPQLWSLMEAKIKAGENTDLQVRIGDVLIPCHLLPLQCFSEYFEELVHPGQAVVEFPEHEVTPAAFRIVYEWILNPDRKLEWMHFVAVLSAAEFLRIPMLVECCWRYLDNSRVIENVAFYVFLQGCHFSNTQLQSMMLRRICRFFLSLVSTPEFCELSFEELSVLLSSNIIGVFKETDVLYSACQWLLYDWSERQEELESVMQLIRFECMEVSDLARFCVYQECATLQPILKHPVTKAAVDRALATICCPSSTVTLEPSGDGFVQGRRSTLERVRLLPDSPETLAYTGGDTSFERFIEFLAVLRDTPDMWKTFRPYGKNVGLLDDVFGMCSLEK
ncbi:kelch-like protein 41b [Anopheles nili]|uniref:kelch-like protein 41b n=1 Tax=Anopheles nili TaxID=185578 RepID=UPI00237AC927|nr:kelch-like protein 41b [Anopheles nili]